MEQTQPTSSAIGDQKSVLVMRNISKAFPGVQALQSIDFECQSGEIHALLGANGAGKSTLMNILTGALKPDEGDIWLQGQQMLFNNPRDAITQGIAMIRQEFDLVPWLSIADNIFLGREHLSGPGIIDQKLLHDEARAILELLGVELDLEMPVVMCSAAQQQLVEIAKALSLHADLIIMDEPSTSLAERELAHLFEIAINLRQQGKTIIYISHRLDEVFEICDRATVLRDGQYVGTVTVEQTERSELIRMMVGEVGRMVNHRATSYSSDKVLLEAKGLTGKGTISDVGLTLYHGQVLGIAGLMGAGKTSVARALSGADQLDSGEIYLDSVPLHLGSPQDAIQSGIVLVPEDRRKHGLFTRMPITRNVGIAQLDHVTQIGFVSGQRERLLANKAVQQFDIITPSVDQLVRYLSGGNQQKVVISKWLVQKPQPRVVIMDEPTRGIDVGAKEEIYQMIDQLARQGAGVIVASSELPELLRLCDSIVVLYEGRVMGVLAAQDATQECILSLASGIPLNLSQVVPGEIQ